MLFSTGGQSVSAEQLRNSGPARGIDGCAILWWVTV